MRPITDPVVIDLVRRVQARLTPENYNQEVWCGTACCIASHLCEVAAEHHPDAAVRKDAARAIKQRAVGRLAADILDMEFGALKEGLFSGAPAVKWPLWLAKEWGREMDRSLEDEKYNPRPAYVDIARRRLDHFLETGE